MWEAHNLGNPDFLWAAIAFTGGIGGQQRAPCGALSAGAVYLGLHYRCPPDEKQRAKQGRVNAREDAAELVKSFLQRFGAISCFELVGVDFSRPGAYQEFQASGIWRDKCDQYVKFVIEKLYELEEKRNVTKDQQKVIIYTQPGCPYCAAAKQDLEERGITYKEISIENNPDALREVMRLSGGKGIVPVLVTGDEVKVGYGGG
jgi:glutaredoxin 3